MKKRFLFILVIVFVLIPNCFVSVEAQSANYFNKCSNNSSDVPLGDDCSGWYASEGRFVPYTPPLPEYDTAKYPLNVLILVDVSGSLRYKAYSGASGFGSKLEMLNATLNKIYDSIAAYDNVPNVAGRTSSFKVCPFKGTFDSTKCSTGVRTQFNDNDLGGQTNIKAALDNVESMLGSKCSSDSVPVVFLLTDGYGTRIDDLNLSNSSNSYVFYENVKSLANLGNIPSTFGCHELQVYTFGIGMSKNDPLAAYLLNPISDNYYALDDSTRYTEGKVLYDILDDSNQGKDKSYSGVFASLGGSPEYGLFSGESHLSTTSTHKNQVVFEFSGLDITTTAENPNLFYEAWGEKMEDYDNTVDGKPVSDHRRFRFYLPLDKKYAFTYDSAVKDNKNVITGIMFKFADPLTTNPPWEQMCFSYEECNALYEDLWTIDNVSYGNITYNRVNFLRSKVNQKIGNKDAHNLIGVRIRVNIPQSDVKSINIRGVTAHSSIENSNPVDGSYILDADASNELNDIFKEKISYASQKVIGYSDPIPAHTEHTSCTSKKVSLELYTDSLPTFIPEGYYLSDSDPNARLRFYHLQDGVVQNENGSTCVKVNVDVDTIITEDFNLDFRPIGSNTYVGGGFSWGGATVSNTFHWYYGSLLSPDNKKPIVKINYSNISIKQDERYVPIDTIIGLGNNVSLNEVKLYTSESCSSSRLINSVSKFDELVWRKIGANITSRISHVNFSAGFHSIHNNDDASGSSEMPLSKTSSYISSGHGYDDVNNGDMKQVCSTDNTDIDQDDSSNRFDNEKVVNCDAFPLVKNFNVTYGLSLKNAYIHKQTSDVTYDDKSGDSNFTDAGTYYYIPLNYSQNNLYINVASNENNYYFSTVEGIQFNVNKTCYGGSPENILSSLRYRPIDVNDPFPSSDSHDKSTYPKNWRDWYCGSGSSCTGSNSNKIRLANSYRNYPHNPLYKIEFERGTIRTIRDQVSDYTSFYGIATDGTTDGTTDGKSSFVDDFFTNNGNPSTSSSYCGLGKWATSCDAY